MNDSGSVHYKITRVLGEGAFGTVYEGERIGQGLSRRVAMKLLHPTHSGQSGIESRLRDEARMLAMIRHRAIVRVDDLIRVEDAWCVVMEYVDGADLAQLLGHGVVPPRAALQIAEEVASALHAAYTQPGPEGKPLHLVHRDVKPQNIRLTPQGEVKLLDFGIARAEFTGREADTGGPGMGTLTYMAPERFRGEDRAAGDVYALGVTLFQLLVGVAPGASAVDPDRRPPGQALADKWAWLQELEPGVPELLTAMMETMPGDRPSARDCARRLAELRLRVAGDLLEDWAEGALGEISSGGWSPPAPLTPANATLQVGRTFDAPMGHIHSMPKLPSPGPRFSLAPTDPARPKQTSRRVILLSALAGGAVIATLALAVRALETNPATPTAALASGPEAGPEAARHPAAATSTSPGGSGSATSPSPPGGVSPSAPSSTAPSTATTPSTTMAPSTGTALSTASPGSALASAHPATALLTAHAGTAHAAPPSTPTAGSADGKPAATARPHPADSGATASPAAAPATGTVDVSGVDRAVLSGPGGSAAPGVVPVGTYTAAVDFSDGTHITVRGIEVRAGLKTSVRCDAAFASCVVGSPVQ